MGSNPVQAWIFFRPYFHYYLSSAHYIEDRFHSRLYPQFKYMTFIYSQPFSDKKIRQEILKVVACLLPLILCIKHRPSNFKRWMEASAGRQTCLKFPWILDVEKGSVLEIPCLADNLMSQQLFKFPFTWMWHIVTLWYPFSQEVLNVYKWHATCILHLWFSSWIFVKVFLNLILTILYTCSDTPVITSWTLVTWTFDNVY